jgi:regulator of nucleoside diphosphate kinase
MKSLNKLEILKMSKKKIMIGKEEYNKLLEMIAEMGCSADDRTKERLEELERELKACSVIDSTELPSDFVSMDSTVEFTDVDSGEVLKYTITWPETADFENNKISVLAPIGTALLGYKAGDIIEWKVPAGTKRFKINNIMR